MAAAVFAPYNTILHEKSSIQEILLKHSGTAYTHSRIQETLPVVDTYYITYIFVRTSILIY